MTLEMIMTRHVITVNMDDALLKVRDLFERYKFHHVVVLEQRRVVGVISDRDLLRNISPFAGKPVERALDTASLRKRVHQIMTRVAILGVTGYSALELVKLLLRHPQAEIVTVTSRQEGNPHIAMVHPSLAGRIDICCEDLGPVAVAARAECVFSCLPHGVTSTLVPHLLSAGARVIDFSADYRLRDPQQYQEFIRLYDALGASLHGPLTSAREMIALVPKDNPFSVRPIRCVTRRWLQSDSADLLEFTRWISALRTPAEKATALAWAFATLQSNHAKPRAVQTREARPLLRGDLAWHGFLVGGESRSQTAACDRMAAGP